MKNLEKNASIRDVAKASGVSIATVSRFLNGNKNIKDSNRIRIEEAIEKLNYIPNKNVVGVFGKKSYLIGLIVPSLMNPYFSQFTTLIIRKLQELNYRSLIFITDNNKDTELKIWNELGGYRVDGVISIRSASEDIINAFNIPVVMFEGDNDINCSNIIADNYRGGQLAFDHLYSKNCKRYVHVKGPSIYRAHNERFNGFRDQADKKGKNVIILQMPDDNLDTIKMIEEYEKFEFKDGDGIFVYSDIQAITLVEYLQKSGFRIPEDLMVIGFDNSKFAELIKPKLTTIEQSVTNLADICVKTLLNNLKDNGEKNHIKKEQIISVKLIERESTKNKY